ncbi:ImmA/IrrE family metallo-endopeptidase [Oleiharenicola lentus]|uniref:ImmA/IrrE family metallo-endopeptidase n=1 Tax=Oleiharenicola lentus TaxID=2508720 RepID=UPI003F66FEA6
MLPKDDTPPAPPLRVWRHKSVLKLLADHQATDPVAVIRRLARAKVQEAKAALWHGPPFEPEHLASWMGITVQPAVEDIRADARIFPNANLDLMLEYNPATPRQRIRFSICHEIVHTFFSDCYEMERRRGQKADFDPVHAEFERLCNIGAAELLMPWDDFTERMNVRPIDGSLILRLQEDFDVSLEACLNRIVDLSPLPCAVVLFGEKYSKKELRLGAGSVREFDLGLASQRPKLRVAYSRNSTSWTAYIPKSKSVPLADSAVYKCIGRSSFANGKEYWDFLNLNLKVYATELPLVTQKSYPSVAAYIELV